MGNSTGNADKKFMTTSTNNKTEKKCWNMLGLKEKNNTTKFIFNVICFINNDDDYQFEYLKLQKQKKGMLL